MTITTEEFVSNFHSLTGTTIAERRENLFIYLNKLKQAGFKDIEFSAVQPQTPLEEKFKIETLIYFRQTSGILEVLKSENPILIKRVLKENWFVNEAFRDVTDEQLITLIFPYVSFRVKEKIANKLSLHLNDSEKADQYFNAVNEKYGIYLASKLLAACSADVILKNIESNRIKPSPKQLLIIIKKYPHITEPIFKLLKGKNINVREFYKNSFLYVAQHDNVLFWKLLKEYNLSVRLGWRATNNFVLANKQDVIENPTSYYEHLHNKQVIKSLKGDFGNYFYNLFPKSLSKLDEWHYEYIFSLAEQLSNKQGLDLLFTTFKKAYGTEIWDHPQYVYPKLLEMLPLDERERRLKKEYKPRDFSEDEWTCYQNTKNSIPYLKKRIHLTSDVQDRAKIVHCLVETCRINKDKATLLKICEYMLSQQRNDHISVRLAFLNALENNFKLENLEEQHWTSVNEFIQIFALNKETFYEEDTFLQAYINFKLENNLPVKEELTKWLKIHSHCLNILEKTPQYEKFCLLMFLEIIPEIYSGTELRSYNLSLLRCLITWNNKHPKDQISLFTFASGMETLKGLLIQNEYVYEADHIFVYCLCTNTDADERNALLNLYLKSTNTYADVDVMNKLIQSEPLTVLQNIDVVTQCVLKKDEDRQTDWFFWKRSRNYTHLEIPQKIISICLNTFTEKKSEDISNSEHESIKMNAFRALSYLLESDEFKKLIAPYFPSETKVDLYNVEASRMYSLQKSAVYSLNSFIPASHMLESILSFCKGDFLKLARASLYSISGNTNENTLHLLLDALMDKPVSVRKHALHLTFRTMDKVQIYKVVKLFMESEKNASIRKFILKGVFNFFVKNSDDYSWELVKLNVNALDTNDKEGFGILMQVDKIPPRYMEHYITFTWDALNKLPDPDGEMESKKITLLTSITPDLIRLLSEDFCYSIIQNYLFKDSLNNFQFAVHSFTCKYVICSLLQDQEQRLNSIFTILKNYIGTTWNKPETRRESRNCAVNFVKEFCAHFLSYEYEDSRDVNTLKTFANLWGELLKPHESFEVYLYMQFTLIYLEKLPVPQFVEKVASFCDSLTNTYDFIVINMIYNNFRVCTNYFCGGDETVYGLIENFLECSDSVASSLLVILLLNDYRPTMTETEARYEKVIEILQKKTDPVI